MKKELRNTKKLVYRATAIMFLFQLMGAVGAGIIFFIKDFLKIDILGASAADFWQLFFWATDFFFVGLVVVLAYLIAGLPALAPAFALSIYFSHFAGLSPGESASPLYSAFFSTPRNMGGGVNIGYMGYLIMALVLGYSIKYQFTGWGRLKDNLAPKLDSFIKKLSKKLRFLSSLDGKSALELLDLFILILIVPVASCIASFLVVKYLIAVPFNSLGEALKPILEAAFSKSNAVGGLLMGAMVGFDTVGPVSLSAFSAAAKAAENGNAVLMTVYGLCFAATGWVSFWAWIMNKIFKMGGRFDNDDANLAMSGPINAFFDNMKLTVSFGMSYAYRDPLIVIPCYVFSCAVTGLLAGAFRLANSLYLTAEKITLFKSGELYISFLQPMRSVLKTTHGVLLPFCLFIGTALGALLLILLKEKAYQRQIKNDSYAQTEGDIVVDLRKLVCRFRETELKEGWESKKQDKTLSPH